VFRQATGYAGLNVMKRKWLIALETAQLKTYTDVDRLYMATEFGSVTFLL
jgi:hypothetical protein